ncbi:MAG: HD domain-containing phosphohydrolase [Thermodesulfobacteriota bacterium]
MDQEMKEVSNGQRILVVDDDEAVRRLVERLCRRNGYACFLASNGEEALQLLEKEKVDVVITDIVMPGLDGLELTRRVRERYDSDVIIMTGFAEDYAYEEAIEKGGSDFLCKPVNPRELIIRLGRVLRERAVLGALHGSMARLQEVLEGSIRTVALAVEAKDPYTSGHQRRTAEIACAIATSMGLPEEQTKGIRMAGIIHDVGKIAVPSEILSKPSKLSDIEFALIKTHSQVGYDILKGINFPWPVAEIAYQHHERMDGSGYPRGLKGEEILLEARIAAVADVVEAMASHRPYRPALGIDAALKEIDNKNSSFDREVAKAFKSVFSDGRFRSDYFRLG